MSDTTSDSNAGLLKELIQTPTSRRSLLKVVLGATGGFTCAMAIPGCVGQVSTGLSANGDWVANAWLEISRDSKITLTLSRVEMGQGTYTGIATLLAEELDAEPQSVQVAFAPVAKDYRNPEYGVQVTGGSNSIKSSWIPIRSAAATAREMLVSAAAEVWQVDVSQLSTLDRKVIKNGTKEQLSYGELAELAAQQKQPKQPQLKTPEQFKYIGKYNQRLDNLLKVTGKATYGIDTEVENMLFAVVTHSPTIGGQVKTFDSSKVMGQKGVKDVIKIAAGIAVLADSYWRARKASQSLIVEWTVDPHGPKSTQQVFEMYRQAVAQDDGVSERSEGDIENELETAEQRIEREYEAPFLAHATMEPMNCVAQVSSERADIWVGTQAPDVARIAVAKVTGLSPENVHIHNQFLGGGFGRRSMQDYIAEAAEISFRTGRPVKLVWSREDDMRNDYFRPASYHRIRATIDSAGKLTGWVHRMAAPGILDWYIWNVAPATLPSMPQFLYSSLAQVGLLTAGDTSPFEGAEDIPYDIPNIEVRHTKVDAGVPIGYWRSVGHSQNSFVVETFIDELAYAAKQDPYRFRRQLLQKHPRHLKVLELAAKAANWSEAPSEGYFRGIAVHKSFNTYVAQVVELSVVSGQIDIKKVVCAVDCGTVINPDVVRMQMESGIIFGITAALFGEISLSDGSIQQSNFHDYRMLRMNEAPEIITTMVESSAPPTGVGEPGLPPIAPAIANAMFAATGRRQYTLPLKI